MDGDAVLIAITRLEEKVDNLTKEMSLVREWKHTVTNDINKGVIALNTTNDQQKQLIDIEKKLSDRTCYQHGKLLEEQRSILNDLMIWKASIHGGWIASTAIGGLVVIAAEWIMNYHRG